MKRTTIILFGAFWVLSWETGKFENRCDFNTDMWTGEVTKKCDDLPVRRKTCFENLDDLDDFQRKAPPSISGWKTEVIETFTTISGKESEVCNRDGTITVDGLYMTWFIGASRKESGLN